jgi:hypothetical protein
VIKQGVARRRLAAVAAALVLSGCLPGGSGPTQSDLLGGGEVRFGAVTSASEQNQPYTVGGLVVCTRTRRLTIISVRPAHLVGGMTLQRVGARRRAAHEDSVGTGPGRLPSSLRGPSGYRVTEKCDHGSTKSYSELSLQVERTSPGDAALDGLQIAYRVGGRRHVTTYHFERVLCDQAAEDHIRRCR